MSAAHESYMRRRAEQAAAHRVLVEAGMAVLAALAPAGITCCRGHRERPGRQEIRVFVDDAGQRADCLQAVARTQPALLALVDTVEQQVGPNERWVLGAGAHGATLAPARPIPASGPVDHAALADAVARARAAVLPVLRTRRSPPTHASVLTALEHLAEIVARDDGMRVRLMLGSDGLAHVRTSTLGVHHAERHSVMVAATTLARDAFGRDPDLHRAAQTLSRDYDPDSLVLVLDARGSVRVHVDGAVAHGLAATEQPVR